MNEPASKLEGGQAGVSEFCIKETRSGHLCLAFHPTLEQQIL